MSRSVKRAPTLGDAAGQRRALIEWYEPRRCAYPWRRTRDPYAILVSEIMLQQTQAARVAPAFERFLTAFPTLRALAGASVADVLRAWDGLGYNRRAVALSRAARTIVEAHAGGVPSDLVALRALPGVGPYTAAAVASISFGTPVAAIDTNVRRVARRVVLGDDAADEARIDRMAAAWLDRSRPGDWNQAVMDLGRAFCSPRPACGGCPLRSSCLFARAGSSPAPPRRRQAPFAGSSRQVRGDVVGVLRRSGSVSIAALVASTGHEPERVRGAVAALAADGLVRAGRAALAGAQRGRVRLAT